MSITFLRKPVGLLNYDITFYVSKYGADSPYTTGTIKNPFATPEYLLDKNNPANIPEDYYYLMQRIKFLSPPSAGKAKSEWQVNIVLDNGGKHSNKIFELPSLIKPSNDYVSIFYIKGCNNINILGGMFVPYSTNQSAPLMLIINAINLSQMSQVLPQGDANTIEILNSVIKDMVNNQYPPEYGSRTIPAIDILSCGDDCIINAVQFFNNYLCIFMGVTGQGFRIENCLFYNNTKAIVSDRRLLTIYYLMGSQPIPVLSSGLTWSNLKKAFSIPKYIHRCIFSKTNYIIDDYDYAFKASGTVNGNTITISDSDLSLISTDVGNYYPIDTDELAGDILVDSNFNEFTITGNSAFNGSYPFTITVSGSPVGPDFYIKAKNQGTYLIGNLYADYTTDNNNDGIADIAGTFPPKGYGEGKALYPDPYPLTNSSLLLDITPGTELNIIENLNNIYNNTNDIKTISQDVDTKLTNLKTEEEEHIKLESQRVYYFDVNSLNATIRQMENTIVLYTGDTKTFTYTLLDSEGAPFNLTNYQIKIIMKKYIDDTTSIFEKNGIINAPQTGIFSFTINGSEIVEPGMFYLEYQLLDIQNNKITIGRQQVNILKSLKSGV